MRIRRIQLVGLAAAMIGVTAGNAQADDPRIISTAETLPVSTSDPNPAAPIDSGDVTIATGGGSITVTAGQTAVTVDSNNDVTNNGVIASNDANDTTGILLTNGFSGTILNTGAINLVEPYVLADTDTDGDVDGDFALGANRNGILLEALDVFTGNITSSGTITIEGQDSAGIRLDGRLDGDGSTTGHLTLSGQISVIGENSHGVLISGGATGGVAGDVFLRSDMTVRGEGSSGATINAPIDGELRVNGDWLVTGFHSTVRPEDVTHLEPLDDLLIGGPALAVHFSVADGVTIEGVGAEDDPNDDGDGVIAGDADDNASASIRSYGSSPAVLIQADSSADLILGATSALGGYGFHNRGSIRADGIYDGIVATGLRIEGNGIRTVTTAAGVLNDFSIDVLSIEADAYGVFIGANADVPVLNNRRVIGAGSFSEDTDTAYAIYFDNNAMAGSLINSGFIRSLLRGEAGSAVAIFDDSDTLATITNSGSITADVVATDDDPTDGIIPTVTGSGIAIDLSNSTINVLIEQIPDTPFTDDDLVDNDITQRPPIIIRGDILLGTGDEIIDLQTGSILGDIDFNDGAGTFDISGGATYQGVLSHGIGNVNVSVTNGSFGLSDGTAVTLQSLTIGDDSVAEDSVLGVFLNPDAVVPAVTATTVTFGSDASINPVVPSGLVEITTPLEFLSAGAMFGANNVIGPVTGEGTPFLYNLNVVALDPIVEGGANSLGATFTFKSATALGLTTNEAIAFDPIIVALRTNAEAAAALVSIDNAFDFTDAYEDLMPSYASGATELAATAIQQMQGATSNRLAATRLHDLDDVSAWAQEIAYGVTREPPDANGQAFRGHGFGIATGIDGPLNNGGLFGISASFITSEVEEPGRPEGEISATFGQLNAYLGTAMGPIDLDFIGGFGLGKLHARRFVEIGDDFTARTDGDWWSYEGHGAVRASVPLSLGDWMVITPQAALTYVGLQENGYTEEGGGSAIDYDVDSAFSQRLWGDVGVEFGARWRMRGEGVIAPRVFVGYRANLLDEEAERSFRFASGGDSFTLTDEGLGDGGPLVGIGIDATNGYSTFTLAYEGEFGDQVERHSLNAAIRFRF